MFYLNIFTGYTDRTINISNLLPASTYKLKGLRHHKKGFQISGFWLTDDLAGAPLDTDCSQSHIKIVIN